MIYSKSKEYVVIVSEQNSYTNAILNAIKDFLLILISQIGDEK